MLRRAIAICVSGVALAAVAQAAPRTYESWSVSAALKQPTGVTGSATITPATGLQTFTGASTTYTITANAGYDIRSIIVDGRTITLAPAEKDLKTVTFDNTRLMHTLVANTVAEKYTVTSSVSPARKGAFSPASMKNISYGTAKTVKIIPMKGWEISQVTLNGTPLANPINADGTMTVNFQNNVGPQALAATFAQKHDVNAVISPLGDRTFDVDKKSVVFELDAFRSTSNVKPVTYTWALAGAADNTYATISSTNTGRTVFTALKPGVYTVSLTVSDGSISSTKQVVFTARSASVSASAACITCHKDATDATGNVATQYQATLHSTKAGGPACSTCHGNHSTGKKDPSAACATCHTTAHGIAANANVAANCAGCHSTHSLSGSHNDAAGVACGECHTVQGTNFATSLHGSRPGKGTFYNDGLDDPNAGALGRGFGNFVDVPYAQLPCAECHNAAATTDPATGVDTWAGASCADCHNPANPTAAVSMNQCFGCHSRQAYELSPQGFGLSDVHISAGMTCASCHSTTDMHGDGTAKASLLDPGAITANCKNCHGEGKSRGPISSIAEHTQHMNNLDCSTCHMQSVVACYNCHFDNEGIHDGSVTHQKFASARFGGPGANSWRFLVNRVMPDGSKKVFPGSMQSLMADKTAKGDGQDDGQGTTFVAIAPYYSHSITKTGALRCASCHGTETSTKLNNNIAVDVVKWKLGAGEVAAFGPTLASNWEGPKGVIPVPENTGLLKFDFVDLTNPAAPWVPQAMNVASPRVLFKRGADVIHMPGEYTTPLTASQMASLAKPYREGATDSASAHGAANVPADSVQASSTCATCHSGTNTTFTGSLHGNRAGKPFFYNDNLGNAAADGLQKGYGNYVTVDYDNLPCAECHNPTAWKVAGVDTWPGQPVCNDCHGNLTAGVATTAFNAPVSANTCKGCHSRQVNEASQGLTDVHMSGTLADGRPNAGLSCSACHGYTDMHGSGQAKDSLLAEGAVGAKCENCHNDGMRPALMSIPEHSQHLANIACSTCHMESVITCYGCHFDNEASDPADDTILHAKFASGKFGGKAGAAWRFLVNRVMPDGSMKIYPASMQSLVADRTAANAPGEDNAGWTHAAIAPYYSHSITKVNALKCNSCHGIQKAIDLKNGLPIRVVKWAPNTTTYPDGVVPVSAMGASYTVKPSGVIPVPENPVGKLLMDFVDLVNPAAKDTNTYPNITPGLNASGTSPSSRKLFKADGPDSIHMPEKYVKPLTAAQIDALATPQVRP